MDRPEIPEVLIPEKYNPQITKLLGSDQWALLNDEFNVPYDKKLSASGYTLKLSQFTKDEHVVAAFKLYPMINCCGICVSTQASVAHAFQGKGLGTLLNSLRIDIARALGYGLLLCTDVETNEHQRRILARNGWKDLHKFVNPRTKNTVFISAINL